MGGVISVLRIFSKRMKPEGDEETCRSLKAHLSSNGLPSILRDPLLSSQLKHFALSAPRRFSHLFAERDLLNDVEEAVKMADESSFRLIALLATARRTVSVYPAVWDRATASFFSLLDALKPEQSPVEGQPFKSLVENIEPEKLPKTFQLTASLLTALVGEGAGRSIDLGVISRLVSSSLSIPDPALDPSLWAARRAALKVARAALNQVGGGRAALVPHADALLLPVVHLLKSEAKVLAPCSQPESLDLVVELCSFVAHSRLTDCVGAALLRDSVSSILALSSSACALTHPLLLSKCIKSLTALLPRVGAFPGSKEQLYGLKDLYVSVVQLAFGLAAAADPLIASQAKPKALVDASVVVQVIRLVGNASRTAGGLGWPMPLDQAACSINNFRRSASLLIQQAANDEADNLTSLLRPPMPSLSFPEVRARASFATEEVVESVEVVTSTPQRKESRQSKSLLVSPLERSKRALASPDSTVVAVVELEDCSISEPARRTPGKSDGLKELKAPSPELVDLEPESDSMSIEEPLPKHYKNEQKELLEIPDEPTDVIEVSDGENEPSVEKMFSTFVPELIS